MCEASLVLSMECQRRKVGLVRDLAGTGCCEQWREIVHTGWHFNLRFIAVIKYHTIVTKKYILLHYYYYYYYKTVITYNYEVAAKFGTSNRVNWGDGNGKTSSQGSLQKCSCSLGCSAVWPCCCVPLKAFSWRQCEAIDLGCNCALNLDFNGTCLLKQMAMF